MIFLEFSVCARGQRPPFIMDHFWMERCDLVLTFDLPSVFLNPPIHRVTSNRGFKVSTIAIHHVSTAARITTAAGGTAAHATAGRTTTAVVANFAGNAFGN